jgi:thiosulfate reductase cytochrome b subunit
VLSVLGYREGNRASSRIALNTLGRGKIAYFRDSSRGSSMDLRMSIGSAIGAASAVAGVVAFHEVYYILYMAILFMYVMSNLSSSLFP